MSGRKRSRRIPAPFNRAPPLQGVLPPDRACFSFRRAGTDSVSTSLPTACALRLRSGQAMGCTLSLLRSFRRLHGCWRLAVGHCGCRDLRRLRCNCAAARYFWAAWTAGCGSPNMSWGGGWTDECVRPYASGCRLGRGRIGGGLMGCDYAGDFGAVGLTSGFGAVGTLSCDAHPDPPPLSFRHPSEARKDESAVCAPIPTPFRAPPHHESA